MAQELRRYTPDKPHLKLLRPLNGVQGDAVGAFESDAMDALCDGAEGDFGVEVSEDLVVDDAACGDEC